MKEMTPEEAIEIAIHCLGVQAEQEVCEYCDIYGNYHTDCKDVAGVAINALKEIEQYREIGTVEECRESLKEENVLKFYYCESEDDYYIGKRVRNFYYARYGKTGFTWFMSRYLPWGEHVIAPNTVWKEHTYPSEPKEIPFFEWLQGFIKKYCGGTVEECRKAVEKQKPKKPKLNYKPRFLGKATYTCPKCGNCCLEEFANERQNNNYCWDCGQAIQWDENLEGMEDEKIKSW